MAKRKVTLSVGKRQMAFILSSRPARTPEPNPRDVTVYTAKMRGLTIVGDKRQDVIKQVLTELGKRMGALLG